MSSLIAPEPDTLVPPPGYVPPPGDVPLATYGPFTIVQRGGLYGGLFVQAAPSSFAPAGSAGIAVQQDVAGPFPGEEEAITWMVTEGCRPGSTLAINPTMPPHYVAIGVGALLLLALR